MAFDRRPEQLIEERRARSGHLATGTLACPLCDAPVALATGFAGPADPLGCPYCDHSGAVRDFLSLGRRRGPRACAVRVIRRR